MQRGEKKTTPYCQGRWLRRGLAVAISALLIIVSFVRPDLITIVDAQVVRSSSTHVRVSNSSLPVPGYASGNGISNFPASATSAQNWRPLPAANQWPTQTQNRQQQASSQPVFERKPSQRIQQASYQSLPPQSQGRSYAGNTSFSTPRTAQRLSNHAASPPAVRQTQFTPPVLPPVGVSVPSAEPPLHQVLKSDSGSLQFNFKDTPWELALRRIAQANGMSLQANQTPPGTFTFFDNHLYSSVEALDILNDHLLPLGFVLVRNGRNLVLFSTDDTVPENLIPFVQPSDLDKLGRNELASVAIPIHQGIPQSVEQETENLIGPLGSVTALSSSRRVLVTDTGANLRRIYRLLTSDSSGSQPSFVYQVRNTSAEEVARAINEFLASKSNVQTGSTGRFSGGTSAGLAVVAEKTTNSLLIRGSAEELSVIRGLIDQLDGAPRQVLIQAVLVEVQLGNTDEFGVELGFQDSVLFNRSVIDNIITVTETVTSPNGTQTTNDRIISQTAAPGFNFNNQPLGNNVAISPSTVAGQALSSFGTGRVNGDLGFGGLVLSAGSESVSVLLRALAAKFEIDILSRPQIRALDNHEALIQIGQQVPVVDGVSVTAVGSANPVIRQDQAGIILKVTPRISPEAQVMIQVSAEKSAFQLAPGTGVPIFTDATNGNIIEAPVKDITTANTAVSVQSGQTIVLGGMITKEEVTVERKVPFLGDIPIVGKAFRYDLDQSERRELLIFLTPHVIESREHSDEMKYREIDHIHMPESTKEFDWQLHGGSSFSDCRGPGCQTDGLASSTATGSEDSQTASQTFNSQSAIKPVAHSPAAAPSHSAGDVRQAGHASSNSTNAWKPFSSFRGNTRAKSEPTIQKSNPFLKSGYSDVRPQTPIHNPVPQYPSNQQPAAQSAQPFQIYLPRRRH